MSPQEFKAWFEGFSENMDGPPNQKQWKKINEKIKLIDNSPVQIVREYRPSWYPLWYSNPIGTPVTISSKEHYKFHDGINTVVCDAKVYNGIQNSPTQLLCESNIIDNAREIGRQEYVK